MGSKEYKKDKYAIFKRNDKYWGEKPKVDEVKIKVFLIQNQLL